MKNTENKPTIYFDLDGTVYDLYGTPDWLERITTLADPTAYSDGDALVCMDTLHDTLTALVNAGYRVGVVSWLAKGASAEYNRLVRRVKRAWVRENLPLASEVHIVKYGTPKHRVVNDKRGILVDDNAEVRESWKGLLTINAEGDIIEALRILPN